MPLLDLTVSKSRLIAKSDNEPSPFNLFILFCRGDRYRGDIHRASYHCRAASRLGTIFTRSVRITAGEQ